MSNLADEDEVLVTVITLVYQDGRIGVDSVWTTHEGREERIEELATWGANVHLITKIPLNDGSNDDFNDPAP